MMEAHERRRMTVFRKRHYLNLTSQEARVILHSLIRLRNTLVQQERPTDSVDELILKFSE